MWRERLAFPPTQVTAGLNRVNRAGQMASSGARDVSVGRGNSGCFLNRCSCLGVTADSSLHEVTLGGVWWWWGDQGGDWGTRIPQDDGPDPV